MRTIWILNHYAMTPDLPGGTRHYDIGRQLAARGFQVVIFASNFHHGQFRDLSLAPREKVKVEHRDGLYFVWLRTFPYQLNNWRRYVNMLSFLARSYRVGRTISKLDSRLNPPGMIIGSSVHLLAVYSAYLLSKFHNARFFMEVRDLWPQTFVDMGKMSRNHPVVFFLRRLEAFLYRRAEKIITLPPLAVDYIRSSSVPENKIIWIPNGVDMERFSLLKKASADKNKFVFMYAGAFGETNSLDTILQAAAILQNALLDTVEFVLVGDGSEKSRLLKMKDDLGLRNIRFVESVPKTEIPGILNQADVLMHMEKILLNLARYGGSPNKFYDYLASGKPLIVASRFIMDPIEEIGCGFNVPPENPEALAEACLRLFNMKEEERQQMGARAKEYVKKHFDISVIVDKLMQSVLSG